MNMHGFIAPNRSDRRPSKSRLAPILAWLRSHKPFLAIVVAPTLLVTAYYYLVASDQYHTEAHFTIQSSSGSSGTTSSLGDMFSLAGGLTPSQAQAMGVADFLSSQGAVDILQKKLDIVSMFRRSGTDPISRLNPATPSPERLLSYYKNMVQVHYNRDTGISTLEVRGFRPDDSYRIIQTLLDLGEARVNELNTRSYADGVQAAKRQLDAAEDNVRQVQMRMTTYRQSNKDINPTESGAAQTTLVATLTANVVSARAQLSQMASVIGSSSPQYRAMAARVHSLETQLNSQSGRLAGGGSTIASRLGNYEDLVVLQEFAGKRYEAAAANLEKANEQAQRQSLYLVRVVDPVMPVKSEYPERFRIVSTFLLILMVTYGIGWLIVAGVREHAV